MAQKNNVTINGMVADELGKPISYATVKVSNAERMAYTDDDGEFSFKIDASRFASIQITISTIGKVSVDTTINRAQYSSLIKVNLKNLNLNLNEVKINSERKSNGQTNSSILFDRQAIEQLQAFSLTDILNNLPGKLYSSLDLQGVKNLTLRTNANGNSALNNSLGTAIIIDGAVQNNNANMQNKSIGKYGLAGSVINDSKNGQSYDATFGGVDLRDIPADNIESIEVISGIAPAQYGDLTDGAVIINRQAGKTDFQFASRFNGGSTNLSLSKGFKLKGKLGAINTSLNYLISNDDPRDKLKSYNRISSGIMWTSYFSKALKNTLSFDFSEKLDDAKMDPDDGDDRLTYSKNRKFALSNRLALEINNAFVRRLNVTVSGNIANQESYTQWYLNGNPRPMANKDTTGVYEGYYIPGTYTAVDQVIGRPINFNANVSLLNEFNTGSIPHFVSIGGSLSISSNKGQGVLSDPYNPRRPNQGNQNERPYAFQLIPSLINSGIYIEDKFKFRLLSKNFNISLGLRYDAQNGVGNIQPRINTNYEISKGVRINAAYGISTKSPTMAHRYPSPTYFDIPLINHFTGDVRESLFLVYTEKVVPDNSDLKPSKSTQYEIGLNINKKNFSTSVFGYYKNNINGFNGQETFYPMEVPEYAYTATPGQKPVYFPTGKKILMAGLTGNEVTNNVNSTNYGVEWIASSRKIPVIQTSFSFNTAFNYSTFSNSGYIIRQAATEDILAEKKAWYGIYEAAQSRSYSLTSRLNSDTHIPKLGFVVSMILDLVWEKYSRDYSTERYPYAYVDRYYNYTPITSFDPTNPDYGHLAILGRTETEGKLPFSYANLSMRVSKEIKKRIRFSINAYNVLNIHPVYYNEISKSRILYTEPLGIGAEFTLKF